MNTRTTRLRCFSAAACATLITLVTAWAFLNSTASVERDRTQFAGPQGDYLSEEVPDYRLPDLLAPPPACLGVCS